MKLVKIMRSDIKKIRNRIEWVDICKFLGILAIYIGHFGTDAGDAYVFVFKYHVPLFFFLSGCMDNFDKYDNYFKYIINKIKTILIPFFSYALLAIILESISTNADIDIIRNWINIICRGCIRDQFFAGGLWFLTCLFIIQIIFKIFKYFKNKFLIIFLSLICVVINCAFFITLCQNCHTI